MSRLLESKLTIMQIIDAEEEEDMILHTCYSVVLEFETLYNFYQIL